MPILVPPDPTFVTTSERKVWEALRDQLGDGDVLSCGQRVTDRGKDHEIDIAVAFEGGGVVAEVKGSKVWCDEDGWWIERHGKTSPIDPVTQAREACTRSGTGSLTRRSGGAARPSAGDTLWSFRTPRSTTTSRSSTLRAGRS